MSTRALVLLMALGACARATPSDMEAKAESVAAMRADYSGLGAGADDARLQDQEGNELAWGTLNGRPRILFFGFTHCPAVCPTTLATLEHILKDARAENMEVDFVTVDPERDTPALLKQYLSSFDVRVRGLTGNAEAIARVAGAYRVGYRKIELGGADYTVDHTSAVYLLNASGAVMDMFAYDAPEAEVREKLRALLAAPG